MQQWKRSNMIRMRVGYKDRSDLFVLKQDKIWEGVCTAVNPHTGIDHNPLTGNLNSKTTGANFTGATNKKYVHRLSFVT
ncbi:hypothetical protein KDW_12900 [Dictyobacter vulcani]|uniref:Uncharacterized protein n=1 Tax=Dictyobacter vulcani TaxID=2607529 RepID=A0A5J4KDM6_9CHLR|nr:hypothetical protein KDW_12900 [Dictyobacter vulcani]